MGRSPFRRPKRATTSRSPAPMSPIPWLAILACLVAAVAIAEEAAVNLSCDRPGRLFAAGAPVRITVAAPAAELAWSLVDHRGEQRSGRLSLTDGRGTLDLGELPRGYYELSVGAGEQTVRYPFGVIADHSDADPADTAVNMDGATAWLEGKGRHQELARIVRAMGMGWIRERFSWGQTEPARDQVDWKQYDGVADTFRRHGVRVYQIWHDSPRWTHPDDDRTRNPADLRDVYRFTKRLAEHYRDAVAAWEVWNEPDIDFWPDLGDTFAGLQKAAYLGFKAGDPDLPVLLGSFCRGYCAFDESLFEAGVADYYDVFNWHIYAPPEAYAPTLARYREMLDRYGCGDRPIWLTEAGIRLVATEPGGELNAADERRQAEFVPKSVAASLAAGTDRHYFFVYPYYLENGVQFGALRADLSPRPGLIALAAAADLLGAGRYLGRYPVVADDAYAYAFDSGRERVLVIWARVPAEVELPVGDAARVLDAYGRENDVRPANGVLRLAIGPAPLYVAGVDDGLIAALTGPTRAPGALPANRPSPIVVRGQATGAPLDKGANTYIVGLDPFDYRVEVYNLSETAPAAGRVAIEAPSGWRADPAEQDVDLPPMGREVFTVRLTPSAARGPLKLWVRPSFAGQTPAPSVSYFALDPAKIEPVASELLDLDSPDVWRANIGADGRMSIAAGAEGGVRFDLTFPHPGDRWCYPRVEFAQPRDLSAFDGITFEYRCSVDDPQTILRMQLIEPDEAHYLADAGRAVTAWTRATCLFQNFHWGSYSPADRNQRLDLDRLAGLMIGLNTKRDDLWYEVREVRAVRLFER